MRAVIADIVIVAHRHCLYSLGSPASHLLYRAASPLHIPGCRSWGRTFQDAAQSESAASQDSGFRPWSPQVTNDEVGTWNWNFNRKSDTTIGYRWDYFSWKEKSHKEIIQIIGQTNLEMIQTVYNHNQEIEWLNGKIYFWMFLFLPFIKTTPVENTIGTRWIKIEKRCTRSLDREDLTTFWHIAFD